jgi:dTDP-4-amino-4,6-dideoxygalactose transaminase
MAVHLAGARPVVTEISGATFNMDFADALNRVTPGTKGAIVVHFGGLISPEFPEFVEEMHRRGLFVVEDAAHAPGAELGSRRSGSFGDAGCFSFYPTKVMTTGEGGMLVSNREHVLLAARSLQSRGLDLESPAERYIRPGRNNRFTEIAAALGLSQLKCLPAFLARRRAIARFYDERLGENGFWRPLRSPAACLSSCWRYVVIPEGHMDRVRLKQALAADEISVDWAYDPPLHLQPVFRQLFHTSPGMLPYSEALLSRHICLPMHALLLEQDAEYVLDRLRYHTSVLAASP